MEIVYEYNILWIKESRYFIEACFVKVFKGSGIKGVRMEGRGIAAFLPGPRLPCFQAPFSQSLPSQ